MPHREYANEISVHLEEEAAKGSKKMVCGANETNSRRPGVALAVFVLLRHNVDVSQQFILNERTKIFS